ncbi:hypothetical protein ACFE04_000849 [Oxalis oulophora]
MSKNKEQEEASSARNLENETPSNQGSQDLLRQLLLAINGLNANLQHMKTGVPPLVIENPDNIETPNSAFESQTHDAREETIHVSVNQGPSVMDIKIGELIKMVSNLNLTLIKPCKVLGEERHNPRTPRITLFPPFREKKGFHSHCPST